MNISSLHTIWGKKNHEQQQREYFVIGNVRSRLFMMLEIYHAIFHENTKQSTWKSFFSSNKSHTTGDDNASLYLIDSDLKDEQLFEVIKIDNKQQQQPAFT